MRNSGRALIGIWTATTAGYAGWLDGRCLFGMASVVVAMLSLPSLAHAQTPIVLGPTSTLQWDMSVPPATAQSYSYSLSIDSGNPLPLGNVTCAAGPSATWPATCKVLAASFLPAGSHNLTMTATTPQGTSLPSAPYAYLTVIIPVPQGLRLVP